MRVWDLRATFMPGRRGAGMTVWPDASYVMRLPDAHGGAREVTVLTGDLDRGGFFSVRMLLAVKEISI